MEKLTHKLLVAVLILLIVLFLLFSGGAISVTIEYGGMMGSGFSTGVSWMWLPALLFLMLSILMCRVIYPKKKIQE